jgi:hypothetical protein
MPRANGSLLIVDPNAPRAREADTSTCSHCQRVIVLHDEQGKRRENVAVHCHGCDKVICVPCAETARCEPFERKLEAIEGRSRLFAALGA